MKVGTANLYKYGKSLYFLITTMLQKHEVISNDPVKNLFFFSFCSLEFNLIYRFHFLKSDFVVNMLHKHSNIHTSTKRKIIK